MIAMIMIMISSATFTVNKDEYIAPVMLLSSAALGIWYQVLLTSLDCDNALYVFLNA